MHKLFSFFLSDRFFLLLLLSALMLFAVRGCVAPTPAITEPYYIDRYPRAGSEEVQWVVSFEFDSAEEAWGLIKKIEAIK